jgi:hypothetical protein
MVGPIPKKTKEKAVARFYSIFAVCQLALPDLKRKTRHPGGFSPSIQLPNQAAVA